MLHNNKYNQIKLLTKLSCMCWFIEHHALQDAKEANDQACVSILENLHKDIDRYIEALQKEMCNQ